MKKPSPDIHLSLFVQKTVTLFIRLILFFLFVSTNIAAQDNTLFQMPVIPQSNQLNPALMSSCRIYVALPVLSSVDLNIRNTGFGFHDVVHTGVGAQTDTYSLDLSNLDKKLSGTNFFLTDLNIDLLGFGFPVSDWYFTFGISNHSELRLTYPHDIASLKDGNWDVAGGKAIPITLNGLGLDFTVWNSICVSAAREVADGLKVGLRVKYLQGMANINTRHSTLELNTTDNPIGLEADMKYLLNASFPVQLGYATNGLVNSVNFDDVFNNIIGDYIFNGNRGMSIDAGLVYDLDEITQFTASVIDLGFIRWKKNVNNFEAGGKAVFSGIDFDQYQLNPVQTDFLNALQDSLSRAFYADGSKKPYTTMNPVRIFGGVTRELVPNIKAGAMTRIEVYDLHFRPSLTLSLNYTPLSWIATSLSYSIMNSKFDQIGAGLALGNKGAQFYVITDNIPVRFTRNAGSHIMWPYNARMISLRFGLNLLFGCKEEPETNSGSQRYGRDKICPAYW
jgi:hypothetical protein